jgi:hypothetical protein
MLVLESIPFFLSGITAAVLNPEATTLGNVQHIATSQDQAFDDLVAPFSRSDVVPLKLAHPRYIDSALHFHYSARGRPLKLGLVWLMRKWLS